MTPSQYSHNTIVISSQYSHNTIMIPSQYSHNTIRIPSQYSHNTIIPSQYSHNTTGIPSQYSRNTAMIPSHSHNTIRIPSQYSHNTIVIPSQYSRNTAMILPRYSHNTTVILAFPPQELGTPSEEIWPGYSELPVAKKVTFTKQPYNNLRKKFPYLTGSGFDLLNRFLTYDPKKRITAEQALEHAFFKVQNHPCMSDSNWQ